VLKLRRAVRHVLDFCYPGICAVCGAACEPEVPLCEPCRIDLHALETAAACERCGLPLAEHNAPCPRCLGKGVPYYDRILRLGIFDGPIKQLIHHAKYHHRWPLAEFLADRLLDQERVKALLSELKPDELRLVPVPLYFTRQIRRGYNQADVIAKRLSRRCGIRLVKPVSRVRPTQSQTHLSPTKRDENVRHAFGLVDADCLRGKHVIVVDDVMTTGATLQAVARAIVPAKPASLCALTIAVADPKRRDFEQV
jgi:ComF family protein